jgi:serine protease inhibitor
MEQDDLSNTFTNVCSSESKFCLCLNWETCFEPNNTTKQKFNNNSGNEEFVDMMAMINDFNYYENQNAQNLEIPFSGEKYCVGFILPKSNDNFVLFKREFLSQLYNIIQNNKKKCSVSIKIPRISEPKCTNMIKYLEHLSITNSFIENIDHKMYIPNTSPIIFEANKPFCYYIKHISTNQIFFIGNYFGNVFKY